MMASPKFGTTGALDRGPLLPVPNLGLSCRQLFTSETIPSLGFEWVGNTPKPSVLNLGLEDRDDLASFPVPNLVLASTHRRGQSECRNLPMRLCTDATDHNSTSVPKRVFAWQRTEVGL